jgi:Family of unknown function (DUF6516)
MPAISFPEYAREIEDILNRMVVADEAILVNLRVDQRSIVRGLITGSLEFQDGSTLHFREFVDISQTEPKIMYAYHYQDAGHNLIFRYDNAAHRPALPQPEHKHTPSILETSSVPTLGGVLDQLIRQMA